MSIGAIPHDRASAQIGAGKEQSRTEKAKETPATEREEGASRSALAESVTAPRDEYIADNGESGKFPGIYRVEADDSGSPVIVFDRPEASEENAQAADEAGPEEAADTTKPKPEKAKDPDDKKEDTYWGKMDTDRVEAEIKQIKQRVQQLEQRLQSASGGEDAKERQKLEKELAQAQSELRSKDNDAYRKAHAVVTSGKE